MFFIHQIFYPMSYNNLAKNPSQSFLLNLTPLLIALTMLTACVKESTSEEKARLQIRLTDAPGNYDEVNVDIVGVEVTGAESGNISLNVASGIYNLLDLTGGADTLIATGDMLAGKLQQIRLILGPNNTVVVGGISYPLSTPSAMQSGLKLQAHKDLIPGVDYSILLDFDAGLSVVNQGNGEYSLKPVIRVIDQGISGSISGSVSPASALVPVVATDGVNSFSSYTDSSGVFLISGVTEGNYSLIVSPLAPLLPDTIFNVAVVNGQNTPVGVINL
jgi:hypothetical protein